MDPSHIKWVTSKKNDLLVGKIIGGDEFGSPIYICRVKHNGHVYPGKYVDAIGDDKFDNGYASYDGVETGFPEWQIATGFENSFKWVKQSGPFNELDLLESGNVPVKAGYEVIDDGYDTKLFYIARTLVTHNGKEIGITPGKISEGSGAKVGYAGTEYESTEYEVLVYSRPTAPTLE